MQLPSTTSFLHTAFVGLVSTGENAEIKSAGGGMYGPDMGSSECEMDVMEGEAQCTGTRRKEGNCIGPQYADKLLIY